MNERLAKKQAEREIRNAERLKKRKELQAELFEQKRLAKAERNKKYRPAKGEPINLSRKKTSLAKTIKNLTDGYVTQVIRQTENLSLETIKDHPELIESKKLQIKFKRLLKNKKDEDTKTS